MKILVKPVIVAAFVFCIGKLHSIFLVQKIFHVRPGRYHKEGNTAFFTDLSEIFVYLSQLFFLYDNYFLIIYNQRYFGFWDQSLKKLSRIRENRKEKT